MLKKIKTVVRKNPVLEGMIYLIHNNLLPFVNFSGASIEDKDVPESVEYIEAVTGIYTSKLSAHGIEISNKTILEVGPGDNLGVALKLISLGAKKVICLDRFRCQRNENKVWAVYRELIERMTPKQREMASEAVLFTQDGYSFWSERIQYIVGTEVEKSPEILGREIADIILSNAVLEHVYNLEETFRNLVLLLKPGGYMYHGVDLRCHNRFKGKSELFFLTIPQWLWNLMGRNLGSPNRKRIGYYRDLFEKLRLTLISEEVTLEVDAEEIEKIYGHLDKEFEGTSKEELEALAVAFVLRLENNQMVKM
jgi:SAM-dependent methyltransferase